ncbi:MAG: Rne/Rng family ribonuclease [Phycisphaerales bacterium]
MTPARKKARSRTTKPAGAERAADKLAPPHAKPVPRPKPGKPGKPARAGASDRAVGDAAKRRGRRGGDRRGGAAVADAGHASPVDHPIDGTVDVHARTSESATEHLDGGAPSTTSLAADGVLESSDAAGWSERSGAPFVDEAFIDALPADEASVDSPIDDDRSEPTDGSEPHTAHGERREGEASDGRTDAEELPDAGGNGRPHGRGAPERAIADGADDESESAAQGGSFSFTPIAPPGSQVMIVNDTPGEECRIAILQKTDQGDRLEALFMERATTATQVGNIYKGRVTNVEPAIQAAFVDFGAPQAGFLHISDLHPRYFPTGDKTERVGKKIPRRERPMMQEALRRGDEVLVQVLKQGIGTKGPTLTSYLSIPGRLLVMMPWMDKSGVSRKVEDEDQRREMRRILDSLNLPDGFGFILRTAGFDRTKVELQRDAQYLLRLWKVMEKRMHAVGAPCELYTESDLLIRTIRDVVDSSIDSIVVDSGSAFTRAKGFLEVVAPRSAPRVLFYDRQMPIFHAFDIERQIELTHSRIVPLPSGGALVVDQTEALVAIDVNSGRSRAARDSETNAYHTNCEAVEEIARQLRLRDLGGVIVNDLIDMRSAKHRRDIEERFHQALKKDRARTTIAPISEFGILEMTRQRMRPSLRKTHYSDCPHCAGHGEVKMPDAVAGDAIRSIANLLHFDRVKRVEMACSTRVASLILSSRRRAIDELEDRSGKKVEIRISEALALDRVDLYAYDDRGADIDITKLPSPRAPRMSELANELPAPPDERAAPAAPSGDEGGERGGRRRRRRGSPGPADATAIAMLGGFDDLPLEDEPALHPNSRNGRDAARRRHRAHRALRRRHVPQRGRRRPERTAARRRAGGGAPRRQAPALSRHRPWSFPGRRAPPERRATPRMVAADVDVGAGAGAAGVVPARTCPRSAVRSAAPTVSEGSPTAAEAATATAPGRIPRSGRRAATIDSDRAPSARAQPARATPPSRLRRRSRPTQRRGGRGRCADRRRQAASGLRPGEGSWRGVEGDPRPMQGGGRHRREEPHVEPRAGRCARVRSLVRAAGARAGGWTRRRARR